MNQSAETPLTTTANTPQRTSIGLKLPVIVISLLLFAFTIYAYISIRITQGSSIDRVREEMTTETASQIDLIQITLIGTRNTAADLAAAAQSAEFSEDELLRLIRNTLSGGAQVFGSTIAYEPFQFNDERYYWAPYYSWATENELKFNQLGIPRYNYFERDWYIRAKETNLPILTEPYYDSLGNQRWIATWSVPFYDEEGGFKGVATADIDFAQIQEIVGDIQIGNAGYAFLLDSDSTVLAIGENGSRFIDTMTDSMLDTANSRFAVNWDVLVNDMIAGNTGFIEATDTYGVPLLVAYAPVGLDTGWSLALGYPHEEILEQTNQLQITLVLYTILVAIIFGVAIYYFTRTITNPLRQLTVAASRISAENPEAIKDQLGEPIRIETQDELEDLSIAFNQMAFNLKQLLENLEEKVAERTEGIERIATDLRTIADLARELAIIRDLDTLLNASASLIRERLGYYHVGIFLMDDAGEYARLRAASSVAAGQMLASNYRLKVGETGLVGNVTRTGQAYIALDVGEDEVHFKNPYLPNTRSEIALPLRSHGVTFGALDIQAETQNAFDEGDTQTLQILADLLAAAIENAQLAQKVEGTISELTRAGNAQIRQVWGTVSSQKARPSYEYDGLQIRAVPPHLSPELLGQLQNGQPIVMEEKNGSRMDRRNVLLVPLMVLNQVIGVIGLEQEDPARAWTEDQIAIAQASASRAALTLENARLLEESQSRASKERTIVEATNRIGAALSIENILQTTAEELERVLSSSEVTIQFTDDQDK
ncbi:MAG: GAF domain-containing protein [Anaerolineales bacterium]|nr:GAF domain-containing protein [Anaerolineales bacterium]WKZ38786.1 MAG: GAF domain-containing protein [Anaerolineales bacterium]